MIIVENRFEIRAGAADAILERFRSPKSVHTFPGFVRMDVLHAVLSDETEEVRVCTAWESEAAFEAWTNSDSFRHAHGRRAETAGAERAEAPAAAAHGSGHGSHGSTATGAPASSPIISSKVTRYNVVVTHLPAEAE
ncbi:hypothetical protein GZH47_21285 [Paenibacillus rhizovicinus]|uniref:ABM domain-containing protein n=1 Tax=Paenibacillus rhizovicinus TaxID=2704463 RepID=A0A6C0P4A2_9BACL|nr:antibiotic biosynthesis monooxygenase [Paenibacillus rhizovicinus]QHW33086.1 hypothetical protein GZH47_21285 [Paenibacillus rhizovicinus]